MKRTAADIRRACARVLAMPGYEPNPNGESFCNIALQDILSFLGHADFCVDKNHHTMLANDITEKLETTCRRVSFDEGFTMANHGAIVIAAMKLPQHGHVALVYPSPGQYTSGKWQRGDVPFVANVGGIDANGENMNGVRPLNWCFGAKPRLWLVAE